MLSLRCLYVYEYATKYSTMDSNITKGGSVATLTYRKMIKFGGGLVVTLPKAWVDYYQLKPGDKVAVMTNKKLVIKPLSNAKEQRRKG